MLHTETILQYIYLAPKIKWDFGHIEKRKEGFAVLESVTKMDPLAEIREVHIYSDHTNLVYILDNFSHNPTISRQSRPKSHELGSENFCL